MIKVCDAIMSSGKSESAISYMNEHSDRKFIYITPYLDEAKRIRLSCLPLHIVEPEEKWEYKQDQEDDEKWKMFEVAKRTKVMHTAQLISEGRSIATTHQAFMFYTPDIIRNIREKHYTLIIDEDLQVLQRFEVSTNDIDCATAGGLVKFDGSCYSLNDTDYKSGYFYGMIRLLKSRVLERVTEKKGKEDLMFWVLPAEFIQAFDDVFVLTYLFEGQALYNLFKMNDIPYEHIGIRHDETGYHFDENGTYVPEYVRNLASKIHIEESRKLNEVGDHRTALSATWMKGSGEKQEQLKRNIYNYFNNIAPGDGKQRIWTTFKKSKKNYSGAGYTKRFLVLNKKATNEYANCNSLVYAANIFLHPAIKSYYSKHGLKINEDLYALSTMIQWIWRSAIRKGEDIWVYIPSRRMRELFKGWLKSLASGGGDR